MSFTLDSDNIYLKLHTKEATCDALSMITADSQERGRNVLVLAPPPPPPNVQTDVQEVPCSRVGGVTTKGGLSGNGNSNYCGKKQ